MKRILLTITLLAALSCSVLAEVQRGYVRTIKRPGNKAEYLENVQISVKGIDGSVKSTKDGKFELDLQPLNLNAGDPFSLKSVVKPEKALENYEKALNILLITTGEDSEDAGYVREKNSFRKG